MSQKFSKGSIKPTQFILTLSAVLLVTPLAYGVWRLYAHWSTPLDYGRPSTQAVGTSQMQVKGIQFYPKLSDVPNVPTGKFRQGGSTTFVPLRALMQSQLIHSFPQFELSYVEPPVGMQPGSSSGIAMLINDQISFAESSRAIEEKEHQLAKQNEGLTLDEVPVAIDGIGIFVNPQLHENGIKRLTLAQVRDIFTGKVQNWKDVGGLNQKISVISREPNAGSTVDFFIEHVLDNQKLSRNMLSVRDTTTAIRKVANIPGSIGYASTAEAINQQKIRLIEIESKEKKDFVSPCGNVACTFINNNGFADGSYPMTRRLFVIIRRDGKSEEQAGIAYANLLLSDEGQQLVKKAGFVPVR